MLSMNIGERSNFTIQIRRRISVAILIASVAFGLATVARAAQDSFPTPQAAVDALIAAAKNSNAAAANEILGPDAKEAISSGDPVADKAGREQFIAGYDRMHRLAYNTDNQVILYIGAENWPFPIPIVKRGEGWEFDTPAGLKELLFRRIGSNELFTIAALRTLVDAQKQYADAQGGGKLYAQQIMSTPGTHDGLYWKAAVGEPESPIGPLVAEATAAGYGPSSGKTKPFHGYLYRLLTSQGVSAPGGPENYIVDGKMIKGFAFLAYPSDYRSTGVMTFQVNEDGVVLQKDLGKNTVALASQIKDFSPDKSWTPVPEYGD